MKGKWDYKHLAVPLGLAFALVYFIFYFWGYTDSDPAAKYVHLNMLKLAFLGFTGLNGVSFLLGLVQSFVWGLIFAGLFYFGYRHCPCDDCGSCDSGSKA